MVVVAVVAFAVQSGIMDMSSMGGFGSSVAYAECSDQLKKAGLCSRCDVCGELFPTGQLASMGGICRACKAAGAGDKSKDTKKADD